MTDRYGRDTLYLVVRAMAMSPAPVRLRLRNACLRLAVIRPEHVPPDIWQRLDGWWTALTRGGAGGVEGTISMIVESMTDEQAQEAIADLVAIYADLAGRP